jgi:hypothetical protein
VAVEDVLAAVADWKRRANDVSLYTDYYNGVHRIGQYATQAFRRDYLWVLENSRENYCKAVVRGFSSKLKIRGWESNTGTNAGSAAEISDDHGMVRLQNLTHRETYKTGDAYVLVWPDAKGELRAWPKKSSMSVPLTDPADPDEMRCYATLWINEDGYGRVNLYYPDRLERFVTAAKLRQRSMMQSINTTAWPDKKSAFLPYNGDNDPDIIANDPKLPPGRVPAVWFPHDADGIGEHGRSVLEDVVPLQDALNKSVADLIVGGENFAQPLRYLMNYRAKKSIDPESGEVTTEKIDARPTVNKFLAIPGDGPLGQLDPPDATKLLAVHEAYAIKITRVTGLPAHYVLQTQGEPPTGVALRVLSTRMTNLVSEDMDDFTPRWGRVQELLGNPDVRPIWKDPAPTDTTEDLDNAEARKRLGWGFGENLKELGYDADDIVKIVDDANAGAVSAQRAFEAGVQPINLLG